MPDARAARRLRLSGHVQGVGYRPFVYRLARELGVRGWVKNATGAVEIHAEGPADTLYAFALGLVERAPAIARPRLALDQVAEFEGHAGFAILPSEADAEPDIHVPPDYFTCDDCLGELRDPADRRHGYPFINCTQCGPRYTLITALPYDRPNTSMAGFPLCPACRAEYEDPANRRFHAEPVACPVCGPHLEFVAAAGPLPDSPPPSRDQPEGRRTQRSCGPERSEGWAKGPQRGGGEGVDGAAIAGGSASTLSPALPHRGGGDDEAALAAAVVMLKSGGIVAVKGVGGYHLMCDATSDRAVAALRRRKPRPAKPLAVMFPADGRLLAETVHVPAEAKALLESPGRPIVLLRAIEPDSLTPTPSPEGGGESEPLSLRERGRGEGATPLSPLIAPGLDEIGCFLPYSPLHHLLLERFGGPLVATSGNISGEPVLTDNDEAETRLGVIADGFLHHDRPIVRPADDPVFRIVAGRPRPIRLGRGAAPLELDLAAPLPEPVLALGGHMKNAICLAWGRRAVISPHIGELTALRSLETLARVANDLQQLYQVRATRLLLDAHPGYGYRRWARESGLPTTEIRHHRAHASGLAGEFPEVAEWIVFAWDGVGLGDDGSLWGGEAYTGAPGRWRHAAALRAFRLPGGEKAGREPWRSAAAVWWEANPADPGLPECVTVALSQREREQLPMLHQAWGRGLNSPTSSAAGRLFDAAAALVGVCAQASFEGEGPMKLEALAEHRRRGLARAAVLPSPLERPARRAPPKGTSFGAQDATELPSRAEQGMGQMPTEGLGERGTSTAARASPRLREPPALPLVRDAAGLWRTDWSPLLAMLTDVSLGQGERAFRFHLAMADALVDQAIKLREETGAVDVGLTGGVFQNRLLTELVLPGLAAAGFQAHLPERVPVNDAGVSFGQVIEFMSQRQ